MSSPAPAVPPAISPPAPSSNTTSPPPAPAPAATPPPAQPPVTSPPLPVTPPPVASPPPSPIPATPLNASTPPPVPATPPTASTPPPSGSSPSPPSPPPVMPGTGTSPPPPSGKSSPTPPGTISPPSPFKSNPSTNNSSGGNLSAGVVVGIAIAGVALLAILSLLFIFCKKKKRRHNAPPPPPALKADPYGGPVYNRQQNAPSHADHVVTIPPKVPPPPGGLPWPPHSPIHPPPPYPRPPPPPPPIALAPSTAISSEGSGSMYSGSESPRPPPPPPFAFSTNAFQYEELSMATDGFTEANLLGQGGFGYVHRGVLSNGKEVAVKQLKAGSGQGEREFQAEVEVISRVHHKHLVSLVGYCMTGLQRLLVYEFVPNNTLEFHLHSKEGPPLDWSTRVKIALGAAKGLAYLHEDCHPKIIHRDIKASNILLDFNFEPKVSDFGLAKITSDTNTHVSTRVMGTFGYLAPEYASSGKLTDKSDVFSFGVVLLELITGRRPVDTQHTYMDDSLVDWARPLLARAIDEENFGALFDPQLQNEYNHKEMASMVACAAACVRHSARRRPRLSQVVRALEGDVMFSDLAVYSSHGSSDFETGQYKEDMKKFRELTLPSSSEYSGGQTTSEYGLNPSVSSSEAQTTREMEMGKMKKDSEGFLGGGY